MVASKFAGQGRAGNAQRFMPHARNPEQNPGASRERDHDVLARDLRVLVVAAAVVGVPLAVLG